MVISLIFGLTSMALIAGDAEKGQKKAAVCGSCHGADGNKVLMQSYPKLAGQNAKYLVSQLKAFKEGSRKEATMNTQAANLTHKDMEDIAAFYASLKVQHAAVPDEYITAGQQLYQAGDKDKQIPACTACHGVAGKGLAGAGFPAVAGQSPEYTIAQLKAYRDGTRTTDTNSIMRDIAAKMTDEQIKTIAYYLVGLHRTE